MTGFEILGQIVAGWLFADFIGGLLHWWEDRAGEARWPIVGHWVVAPNRLHHVDPMAFTRTGFAWRNSTNWVAVALVAALLVPITGLSPFWAAAAIGGAMTNEVHCWAHRNTAPGPFSRALQSAGWLQSAAHHARHHRGDATTHYCVLTNLVNPLLDAIGFWTKLERGLAAIGMPVNGGTR